MKKNEKFKPLLIPLLLVSFQGLSFLFVKLFQSNIHIISNSIDDKIPFINYFIIPYCFWYVMLFTMPYFLYNKDKNSLCKYLASYIICVLITDVFFIIYPTGVIRPDLLNNNVLNIITNIIYYIDTPAVNCMPSMHCAISMLFILSACTSKKFNTTFKLLVTIISILIMLSTLFIKQHVLIDLITGNILMTIIFIFVNYNKKLVNKTKKLLNI